MDRSDHRNGYKRQSGNYSAMREVMQQMQQSGQLVERRSSKKATSQDRHGRIFDNDFAQPDPSTPGSPNTTALPSPTASQYTSSDRPQTIRAVTPDTFSGDARDDSLSDDAYISSSVTASPSSTVRSKAPSSHYDYAASLDEDREQRTRTRSRTRTLEDQRGEASPTNFLSRTRNRIGSINAPNSQQPLSEDTSSIGFPSVMQSPTTPGSGPPPSRQANRPGAQSFGPSNGSIRKEGFLQSTLPADSGKILQLMKTTCGRMHGILSFRTNSTTAWASGYCAINVASGSLIYQAKGEPALARTLIPDLRGCHVRTQYDAEFRYSYLSVSTHSSGLGLQLRPHVPETFDSWLAALLCWQPIRPKGVQNKMTKPQSITMNESRRVADRRRNSETTSQKDAAIIKVGKMLLWDRQTITGAPPVPVTPRRVSTYKQQRALSTSWRKVGCTLQENGHFKLYPENETQHISFIQLSQLSRCAIQQLEPSVLEDEYCIAIFPQYTATTQSQVWARPIFLSMESRVLFEVWFVLLRAFTIPELYGPEQSLSLEEPPLTPAFPTTQASPPGDMFRVERLLTILVIEARITGAPDDNLGKKPGQVLGPLPNPTIGDYYVEVFLDGEIRAKTAMKMRTNTPFWREDFSFCDLPPVLSSASVRIKTRNASQKDWTLVAHGPYGIGYGEITPMTVAGDLEVSSHDSTYGKVELRLDDLERGVETEKWWSVLDENDEQVGEVLMKVMLEETVVLMSQDYKPMSTLLHYFPNSLTGQLSQAMPGETRRLADYLLNIYQVSGQAGEWIMSLIEEEIDGVQKETPVSRLRYSSRLHSNETHETGPEREMLVRDLGRTATVEANLLFRGNSLLTKALDNHMRRLGKEYLEETIGEKLRDIDESDPECEVDPNKIQNADDLERNWRNLIALTSNMWKAIANSVNKCPPELRSIFRHIKACAEDRYGDFLRVVPYRSVSGFVFLRFFCPAILNPKLFGLLKEHPRARGQRTLTLIAKSLQSLANMVSFGSKEPWMEPMNKFLVSHRTEFKTFIDNLCSIPAERPTQTVSPSYATPIQILSRLPSTSKEGFPSLPFLIDSARNFALLIQLWLENAAVQFNSEPREAQDVNLLRFHHLCIELQQRTKDCLNKAEQAERPNGKFEKTWEDLVEQIDKASLGSGTATAAPSAIPSPNTATVTFLEDASKPSTPLVETNPHGPLSVPPASATGKRNSIGYFSKPMLPMAHRFHENMRNTTEEGTDDDTPPSSASATWTSERLPFATSGRSSYERVEQVAQGQSAPRDIVGGLRDRERDFGRESTASSLNSSTYSLDQSDTVKGVLANPPILQGQTTTHISAQPNQRYASSSLRDRDRDKDKESKVNRFLEFAGRKKDKEREKEKKKDKDKDRDHYLPHSRHSHRNKDRDIDRGSDKGAGSQSDRNSDREGRPKVKPLPRDDRDWDRERERERQRDELRETLRETLSSSSSTPRPRDDDYDDIGPMDETLDGR